MGRAGRRLVWPAAAALTCVWALSVLPGEAESGFGVADVMDAMVVPASDALFGVGRAEPDSEEAWIALRHQAVILGEAGRALTAPGRSRGAEWDAWSVAMSDAAESAAQAIWRGLCGRFDAHDVDAVLFAGGDIIESCTGCHRVYLPLDG